MPVAKRRVKKTEETKDFLKSFEFHGLEFDKSASNAKADCPLCGKANHFFVNPKNGLWDCKSCGEKGNIYTFLKHLHASVTPADKAALKKLAELRKLPPAATKDLIHIGYDASIKRYYLPTYSPENETAEPVLNGLRVWDSAGAVFNTSGLPLPLLNGHALKETDSPDVFIAEGDWDVLALDYIRSQVSETAAVVGAPGAHNFKEKWLEYFKDKNVYLCYDHDDPGREGMQKLAKQLGKVANSIHMINWPEEIPDGYDINDFVSDRCGAKKTPAQIWEELMSMFLEADVEHDGAPQRKVYDKIPTYKELIKEYGKVFHIDRNTKDALAIILATAISIKLPGDPVWLFIVGPPGGGKTLMLSSMRDSELCQYESNLRPHALVSGMRLDDGSDASLIPQLSNRCLVLKDYTEVRSQGKENQEAIYGILRGAFDGHVKYTFGNGLVREYEDCWFSMVAGVTHEIHGDNRASLGERFLKCELLGDDHVPDVHIRAAMEGFDRTNEKELALRYKVAAFLSREIDPENLPTIPEWVKVRLIALSQIVATLRTSVSVSGPKNEMNYRPRAEIGTRLAKTLIKVGRCLAFIMEKSVFDKECYRLMEKVALDTAHGFPQDILFAMLDKHPKPVTVKEICSATHLSRATIDRRLITMLELKQVVRAPLKKAGAGQPELGYVVSPALVKLWQQAKINAS